MIDKPDLIKKLSIMMDMQDTLNYSINPDWINQKNPWSRAAWIESAQMLGHYGYKWWKHHQTNFDQVKLEIIDIWSFGISALLEECKFNHPNAIPSEYLAEKIIKFSKVDFDVNENSFYDATDEFVKNIITNKKFPINDFLKLMKLTEMSIDDIYLWYIGKNTLNQFRDDNGYQDGSYVKDWLGREDNVYLANILNIMDKNTKPEDFSKFIYNELSSKYHQFADVDHRVGYFSFNELLSIHFDIDVDILNDPDLSGFSLNKDRLNRLFLKLQSGHKDKRSAIFIEDMSGNDIPIFRRTNERTQEVWRKIEELKKSVND